MRAATLRTRKGRHRSLPPEALDEKSTFRSAASRACSSPAALAASLLSPQTTAKAQDLSGPSSLRTHPATDALDPQHRTRQANQSANTSNANRRRGYSPRAQKKVLARRV